MISERDKVEYDRDAEQTKADDGKSHDGAAGKGNTEGVVQSFLVGGLGSPDIGVGRDTCTSPQRRNC